MESNTQKALKGMSSQTIVTIILGIVEIGSFSIMSRLLSQNDFGYFAVISAVLAVFSALSDAGIGSAIVQRKDLDQKFLNNAFTLCFVFGGVTCVALFLSSNFLASTIVDESMSTPLKVMSLTLLTSTLSSAYLSILQRQLKFFTIGMINLMALVITTIIAIALAYYGFGYYAIITKAVLASVLSLMMGAILSKTKFYLDWDKKTIKSIWGFSSWLMFSSVFRNFAQQMDRLLMSRLLSVDALGAYNRPKEFITQISSKFNNIFDSALFPVLSGIQENYTKVCSAYKRALSYLNIFSVIMMMSFFFNAELLVRIFFGEQWLSVVPTFQILSCALIFQIDARLADCFLRSLGWTKHQFYFRIIEVISQIIGLIIGAQFGVNGVAVSIVVVNVLCILLKNFYIIKRLRISQIDSIKIILSSWRPMYVLSPIMILLLRILPHSLIYNCISTVIFCVLIGVMLLCFPSTIGDVYKKEVYGKLLNSVKQKLIKHNL